MPESKKTKVIKESKKTKDKPCKNGAHKFTDSLDPWYEKCYFCPAVRKKTSIKVKPVNK